MDLWTMMFVRLAASRRVEFPEQTNWRYWMRRGGKARAKYKG
jgi:hypothetical protein